MRSFRLFWRIVLVEAALIVGSVLAIQAALPSDLAAPNIAAIQHRIWLIAIIALLAALAITYLVLRKTLQLVQRLTAAAQDMAAGQLGREVRIPSNDEFGRLAAAFNAMSRQLSGRIAELQRQSGEIRRNSEQLQTVLGAMIEGVIAVDPDERILLANQAAARMLELSPRELLGKPFWEAVRHPAIQQLVRDAFAGNDQQRVELELPRRQLVLAVLASRLPGEPCPGAVLVLHDITELRRLERMRREFVSNVSHELKTPLTSITAYTETLLEGALDDPEHSRAFVKRIEEQAERLHALIVDLLNLNRIESEADAFEIVPTDVGTVIRASVNDHAAVAESKSLTLSIEPPSEELVGMADADGLRTILDNLLDNAINYTPAGGRVTVRWQPEDEWARIDVQDTGAGIAQEHQARIFERFYRADKARSRQLGGTGLGLAIVKHLCQLFGGSVRVSSQIGQGSTFTVRLRRIAASGGRQPPVFSTFLISEKTGG